MELGLSLGDETPSKPFRFLAKNGSEQNGNDNSNCNDKTGVLGLGFCMAVGINSNKRQEPEKSKENDADDDNTSEDTRDDQRGDSVDTPLQLDLFPLVPRSNTSQTRSLRWSSDNGSSENGSSGNVGQPMARGFDVNRLPAAGGAAEEVSSPNSVASSFQMDFSIFKGGGSMGKAGNKRDSVAPGNDAVDAERASSRASDEDENGLNTRKKLRLSKEQSAYLEESFKEHNTLNPKQKHALAQQLNLMPRQVEVWFQNRRARIKLKQTEVDCEYLKRCCETLTEENRRLHKELQELRALKTSNPFYMQLPATTLTMCPSCERVATTSTALPTPANNSGTTSTVAIPSTSAPATASAKTGSADAIPKAVPFPLSRPRLYPFSQTTMNQPSPPLCSLVEKMTECPGGNQKT